MWALSRSWPYLWHVSCINHRWNLLIMAMYNLYTSMCIKYNSGLHVYALFCYICMYIHKPTSIIYFCLISEMNRETSTLYICIVRISALHKPDRWYFIKRDYICSMLCFILRRLRHIFTRSFVLKCVEGKSDTYASCLHVIMLLHRGILGKAKTKQKSLFF